MYQKIRKKKSEQCFANFFIAAVGHEIFFFDVWLFLTKIFINIQSTFSLSVVYVSICTVHIGKEGQPFFYALRFFAPSLPLSANTAVLDLPPFPLSFFSLYGRKMLCLYKLTKEIRVEPISNDIFF